MNKIKIRPDRIIIFLYVFILLAFQYYSDRTYKALNYGFTLLLFLYIFINMSRYNNNICKYCKIAYGYILWMVSIVILMFAASFWSDNFNASFGKTLIMFFSTLGQISLLIWCSGNKERLKYLIDISILIASFILIKTLVTTPFFAYGNQKLFMMYNKFDKNMFAMMGAFLSICALLMYYNEKRLIYIIGWLLMIFIMILGCSRKGALIAILSWLMFVFFKNNFIKKTIYIFAFFVIGILLIKFIMSNTILYNMIGERLYNLYLSFFGSNSNDVSINERKYMIELGLNLFMKKKIFGWGTDGFAIQMQDVFGRYVYSHCNYVEMLCNFGIIGFLLYYTYYIKIIKATVFQIFKRNTYVIFSFIIFFMFMVFEYGFVSYYEIMHNFFKTLAIISLTCVYNSEKNISKIKKEEHVVNV